MRGVLALACAAVLAWPLLGPRPGDATSRLEAYGWRAVALYEEAETVLPRALAYARWELDSWALSRRGCPCSPPPPVSMGEWSSALSELASERGIRAAVEARLSLSQYLGGDVDPDQESAFGASPEPLGILISGRVEAALEDLVTGSRAERSWEVSVVHPLKIYAMLESADKLSDELSGLPSSIRGRAPSRAEALVRSRELRDELLVRVTSILEGERERLFPLGLRLDYDLSWEESVSSFGWEGGGAVRRSVWIDVRLTYRQPGVELVSRSGVSRGFWCTRRLSKLAVIEVRWSEPDRRGYNLRPAG